MFDKIRLKEILVEYKKRFVQKQWPDENFKWEAVKCFQDNWDVNADDFSGMLKKSLSKSAFIKIKSLRTPRIWTLPWSISTTD